MPIDDTFWLKKWETGETQFHQSVPHPQLLKYFTPAKSEKVLAPLCGKSLDLLWLSQQGHEVTGIELSSIACESFFRENHLKYKILNAKDFTLYQGERISIWCGDFFCFTKEFWNGITSVYDRAALIALPPDLRRKYAQHIIANKSNALAQILLITVEYPDQAMKGPPFSVSEKEVRTLYGDFFHIDKLETQRDPTLSERASKHSTVDVVESVYRLT